MHSFVTEFYKLKRKKVTRNPKLKDLYKISIYSNFSAGNRLKRHWDEKEKLFLWKRKDGPENSQETWSRTGTSSNNCHHVTDCCCSIAKSCLFVTSWTVAHQVSLFYTISWSLLKHMSIESMMPSNHPLPSPSPPAFNLSQHQGLSQWVSSLHQVAKVLELQLHHCYILTNEVPLASPTQLTEFHLCPSLC